MQSKNNKRNRVSNFIKRIINIFNRLSLSLKIITIFFIIYIVIGFFDNLSQAALLNSNGIYVIDIKGEVNQTMYESVKQQIEYLENNNANVKGIILDVDSPGGGVFETIKITKLLKKFKEEKNIDIYSIVYSGVCASGSYWIASISKKIFVTEDSIIGSIGVIATYPNIDELLKKIGIETTIVTAGENKKGLRLLGEHSEDEKKEAEDSLKKIHEIFIKSVKENREENKKPFDTKICNGSTFFGEESLSNCLADELFIYKKDVLTKIENSIKKDKNINGEINMFYFMQSNIAFFKKNKISKDNYYKNIKLLKKPTNYKV